MSELSFLIDLLLNHKLPKGTKDAIALRIKDVEANSIPIRSAPSNIRPVGISSQAPSTQAILDRNPDLAAVASAQPPAPVDIAQTPAAAAAMASRNQAISESLSGKVDKVTGRPRKF